MNKKIKMSVKKKKRIKSYLWEKVADVVCDEAGQILMAKVLRSSSLFGLGILFPICTLLTAGIYLAIETHNCCSDWHFVPDNRRRL